MEHWELLGQTSEQPSQGFKSSFKLWKFGKGLVQNPNCRAPNFGGVTLNILQYPEDFGVLFSSPWCRFCGQTLLEKPRGGFQLFPLIAPIWEFPKFHLLTSVDPEFCCLRFSPKESERPLWVRKSHLRLLSSPKSHLGHLNSPKMPLGTLEQPKISSEIPEQLKISLGTPE